MRTYSKRGSWLSAALTASVFVAGCGGGDVSSLPTDAQDALAIPGEASPHAQEVVRGVADRAEAQALTDPDFANVAVDAENNRVIVYRVGGESSALRARVAPMETSDARVEIRPALVSRTRALALVERIESDRTLLALQGVQVTSWGPAGDGGPFLVGVKGDLDHALAVLQTTYPDFAKQLSVRASSPTPTSRLDDGPPHFAGARYYTQDKGGCSTGFAGKNSNGTYLITAYHCTGPSPVEVWYDSSDFKKMGHFSAWDKTPYDAAFIRATSRPVIYDGVRGNGSQIANVAGVAHPKVGDSLCFSGSYSGRRCGGKVMGWARFSYDTGYETYIVDAWYAFNSSGLALSGEGDSGGPIYASRSSGLIAEGMISAGETQAPAVCPEGGHSRACYYQVYFTDVAEIASRHHLVLTGF